MGSKELARLLDALAALIEKLTALVDIELQEDEHERGPRQPPTRRRRRSPGA